MGRRATAPWGDRRGMTLVEVMVALLIVAGMTIGSVVIINSVTRSNLKAQTMRLTGYIKHTYAQAAIHQQYYRLMIDLDTQEYWVETATQQQIGAPPEIPDEEFIGAPEDMKMPSGGPTRGYDSDDPEGNALGKRRPQYQASEDFLTKRRKLDGVNFFSVATASMQEGRTAGRTAITFYPNGFVERSQIILGEEEAGYMTLEIQPLSGKVDIFSGKQEADRDFFEVEDDD